MKSTTLNMIKTFLLIPICITSFMGCSANENATAQTFVQQDIALANMTSETEEYETKTYINTKHSFTFEYPKQLHYRKKYMEDDGMYFMDDEASLLVYGSTEENESMQLTKMAVHDRYAVQIYDDGEYRICIGSKQKKDITIHMYFKYPIALEDKYKILANRLIQEITN